MSGCSTFSRRIGTERLSLHYVQDGLCQHYGPGAGSDPGPWLIRRLRQFQVEQHIREEGPSHHQVKAGTPTMGGVLIVASTIVPTFLWTDLSNPLVWIGLGSMIGFGAIGFATTSSRSSGGETWG